jgi:hypothetical protein
LAGDVAEQKTVLAEQPAFLRRNGMASGFLLEFIPMNIGAGMTP